MLASGWGDVNEKAVELLGFSSEQFRQVVVLPQGDFRRLLVAKVQEREKILETLFGTDHYKKIEARLKSEAGETWKAIGEVRQNRKGILDNYDVESPRELDERCSELRAQRAVLEEEVAELKTRADKARNDLETGKVTEKFFVELEKAKAEFEQVRSKDELVAKKRQELDLARKAAPIAGLLEQVNTRQDEHRRAEKQLKGADLELKAALETKAAAEQHYEAEQKREPEREAARREVSRLEGLADTFKILDENKAAFTKAQTDHEARAKALLETEELLEERKAQLEEAKGSARPGDRRPREPPGRRPPRGHRLPRGRAARPDRYPPRSRPRGSRELGEVCLGLSRAGALYIPRDESRLIVHKPLNRRNSLCFYRFQIGKKHSSASVCQRCRHESGEPTKTTNLWQSNSLKSLTLNGVCLGFFDSLYVAGGHDGRENLPQPVAEILRASTKTLTEPGLCSSLLHKCCCLLYC